MIINCLLLIIFIQEKVSAWKVSKKKNGIITVITNFYNQNVDYRELKPIPFEVSNETIDRGVRIMYGSAAKAGQFKEYVLLFAKRSTTTVQCGGCLMSAKWVMTAKHCTNL
jgi:hypothetical protein